MKFPFNSFWISCSVLYNAWKDRSLIFGPAINRAYQLESKYAIYPRIIIDKFVAEQVLKYNEELISSQPEIAQEYMRKSNGEIILIDEDSQYYLNYFNTIKQGLNFIESKILLENLINISNKEIDKNKVNLDDDDDTKIKKERIINKYRWLLKYIDESYPSNRFI